MKRSSKLADHYHLILLAKNSGLTSWYELCKTARCSSVKQCLLTGARPDFEKVFLVSEKKQTTIFIQKRS